MPALPALGFIVAAGSAIDTRNRSNRAERKNEKLQDLENAVTADQAARERRNQIRQQRAKQAQIENAAAIAGQSSSSAPLAAASNVQASVNENIGNINAAVQVGQAKSDLRQDIFNLQQPSTLNTAAGIYNSIFETPKIKTS